MNSYLGYTYYKDKDDLWKVIVDNNCFIVALDDSKYISNKKIIYEKNNEETCKKFIDWLVYAQSKLK